VANNNGVGAKSTMDIRKFNLRGSQFTKGGGDWFEAFLNVYTPLSSTLTPIYLPLFNSVAKRKLCLGIKCTGGVAYSPLSPLCSPYTQVTRMSESHILLQALTFLRCAKTLNSVNIHKFLPYTRLFCSYRSGYLNTPNLRHFWARFFQMTGP
jgi:hypothetical protein